LRSYECLFIVHPAADSNELSGSAEKYGEIITGKGGTVHKTDLWGKRKLAYPIEKHSDGNYILLRFEAEPATIAELEFRMRVDDRVLRYMTSYEVPEGAGRSEELMQLTERKERDRRGRGRGRGRGRPYDRHRDDRGGPREPRYESRSPENAPGASPPAGGPAKAAGGDAEPAAAPSAAPAKAESKTEEGGE